MATPLLLFLILLIVQFALWQHAQHVAQAVAQQGLAAGRVQGGSQQTAQAQAHAVLDQLGSSVLIHSAISTSRDPDTTTVTVTGYAEPVLPFFHLPVRSTAAGETEHFSVPGGPP